MLLLGRGHGRQPLMLGRGVDALAVQPDYESVAVEGPPFLGSDLTEPIVRPAPLLGEHTREVAPGVLGLANDEIGPDRRGRHRGPAAEGVQTPPRGKAAELA